MLTTPTQVKPPLPKFDKIPLLDTALKLTHTQHHAKPVALKEELDFMDYESSPYVKSATSVDENNLTLPASPMQPTNLELIATIWRPNVGTLSSISKVGQSIYFSKCTNNCPPNFLSIYSR